MLKKFVKRIILEMQWKQIRLYGDKVNKRLRLNSDEEVELFFQ